jgi:hypothetical protein
VGGKEESGDQTRSQTDKQAKKIGEKGGKGNRRGNEFAPIIGPLLSSKQSRCRTLPSLRVCESFPSVNRTHLAARRSSARSIHVVRIVGVAGNMIVGLDGHTQLRSVGNAQWNGARLSHSRNGETVFRRFHTASERRANGVA